MTWFQKVSNSDIRNILAIMITVGCFLLVYFLIIKHIPDGNKEIVLAATGYVLAKIGDVTAYYFGASKGVTKKEE